ncbi:PapB/FocB family fimbrial expression transcriptional regulator [Pseudomonas oryzihabitans]|uniref:PapB/FocB family fimbrial expression transcriptional regulator n=1 Tax=Pseudomonas oryzihabitans TaxID=47885 RepID=UPI0009E3BFC2|nr:PapB/FocB family fimbrial expression transcriptional regulator [Pseudomonas oryzihabitans]
MAIDTAKLVPGTVDPRHFDLLLGGTSIRGEKVIEALRDHLVTGLTATAAWEKHAVNKSQFSRRLAVISAEHQRAANLSEFYQKG